MKQKYVMIRHNFELESKVLRLISISTNSLCQDSKHFYEKDVRLILSKRPILLEFKSKSASKSHQFVTASSIVCALLVEHPMERFSPSELVECMRVPICASFLAYAFASSHIPASKVMGGAVCTSRNSLCFAKPVSSSSVNTENGEEKCRNLGRKFAFKLGKREREAWKTLHPNSRWLTKEPYFRLSQ